MHGVDSPRGESIARVQGWERWTPVNRPFWPDFAFMMISRGRQSFGMKHAVVDPDPNFKKSHSSWKCWGKRQDWGLHEK